MSPRGSSPIRGLSSVEASIRVVLELSIALSSCGDTSSTDSDRGPSFDSSAWVDRTSETGVESISLDELAE